MDASRPVYQLFLERCVLIEAVQQHRDEADEEAATFFATGCTNWFGLARALCRVDLKWWNGYLWQSRDDAPKTWPASMRAGWKAMEDASELLVAEMLSGEVRLEGTSPTGLRRALLPAELAWPRLAIEFQYGELVDCSSGKHVVLWKDVTEVAPEMPVRKANLIALNAARDAEQRAKWAKWQAAADEIGKSHHGWGKSAVARLVRQQLKPTETWQTISKKIKNTWRIKKTRHDV